LLTEKNSFRNEISGKTITIALEESGSEHPSRPGVKITQKKKKKKKKRMPRAMRSALGPRKVHMNLHPEAHSLVLEFGGLRMLRGGKSALLCERIRT